MQRKSSAHYQRLHRERLREKGLVKKELWVLPEYTDELLAIEKAMRMPRTGAPIPRTTSMNTPPLWTASTLHAALQTPDAFARDEVLVELLEGAEPSLHLVMHGYGDLPLFLAIEGEQIVVEALLWPVHDVPDTARFNEQVLRTHKLFPLSTIGIDTIDGEAVYTMFGALSACSNLADIVFEIEMLADNVIKATEAFEPQLRAAA